MATGGEGAGRRKAGHGKTRKGTVGGDGGGYGERATEGTESTEVKWQGVEEQEIAEVTEGACLESVGCWEWGRKLVICAIGDIRGFSALLFRAFPCPSVARPSLSLGTRSNRSTIGSSAYVSLSRLKSCGWGRSGGKAWRTGEPDVRERCFRGAKGD